MADEEKALRATLVKLVAELRAVQARSYELTEEIDRLLGGGAGVAALLKDVETAFAKAWAWRYANGSDVPYIWTPTRDKPQIKRLLRSLTVEELERRIWVYIKSEEPFYVNARHNFGLFVASINSHADRTAAPVDPDRYSWRCPHDPHCGNRATCAIVAARAPRPELPL